jgi:hypothetical protein
VTSKCIIDGCDRPEELVRGRSAGGLCSGHRWRKRKGLSLETPLRSRRRPRTGLLIEAGLALADANTDDDFDRGVDRLRKSAARYMYALGWRPKK